MKLFTRKGINRALVELAVELRRLSWLGLAIAGLLLGTDANVMTAVVATVWWVMVQTVAFFILARAGGGNDTS